MIDTLAPPSIDPPRFNPARAELIGKIVLARFLQRPVTAILAAAREAERIVRCARLLNGATPALRRHVLEFAVWRHHSSPGEAVGSVEWIHGRPTVVYHSRYLACEYTIDDSLLAARLSRFGQNQVRTALRAVRTLLLLSTRNRITHGMCRTLLQVQHEFLRAGDDTRLVPVTGRELARAVRASGVHAADPTRISRLLRSTVLILPDGIPRPLKLLCPTSRIVLRTLVREILERERQRRATGHLTATWDDEEIARRIRPRPGVFVSRRLVAYCRQALGAPGARIRSRRACYIAATMNFSGFSRLDRMSVLKHAPLAPGVYELRIPPGEPGHAPDCVGVIYLGRAKNLRRRLLAHTARNHRNDRLAHHIRCARLLFRNRIEIGDLKRAEQSLYRLFRDTYGRPPECNKMSP